MKKTLVALAALSAISAFAQTTVTLTGRASMDVSTYAATGSTVGEASDLKNRTRVADTSSRIAFGVNEDLGGGLKAGVYCETGINIDNATANGQANTANANTSEWCSREGRAYFGNATAEVRLGRQNVWWTQGALNEVGSTYLGSDSFTNLQNGGVGVLTVRGENMAKLVAGSATGAFAGSEAYWGTSNANEATAAATTPKSFYRGFKVNYSKDQFVAMWDHQSSTASAAVTAAAGTLGANSFDRKANKVGVGFKYMPDSLVSVQYWQKSRRDVTNGGAALVAPFSTGTLTTVTTAGDAKDSGYGIVVKHALTGTLTAHAQYGKANRVKSLDGDAVADTGATSYTLGLTQAMSKRTHFYTAYHKINNQGAAAYNMVGGNYASGTSRTGADVKMLAIGMIHNF